MLCACIFSPHTLYIFFIIALSSHVKDVVIAAICSFSNIYFGTEEKSDLPLYFSRVSFLHLYSIWLLFRSTLELAILFSLQCCQESVSLSSCGMA